MKAGFRLGHLRDGLTQDQLALEPVGLRQQVAPPAGLACRQRLAQQAQAFLPAATVSATAPQAAAGSRLMVSTSAR